jgi:Kef-type K+ transport system membrane component KefB
MVAFFVAWAADFLGGLGTITGAFLVGLGLRRSAVHHKVAEAMHTIGYALFVPLFFVSVGLQANLRTMDTGLLLFAALVLLVALVGKALGNGLGAWLGGLPPAAALRLGLGMIPRGEVTLIAATVEMREGWIDGGFFSVAVLTVLVTAIAAPLLLKVVFRGGKGQVAGNK